MLTTRIVLTCIAFTLLVPSQVECGAFGNAIASYLSNLKAAKDVCGSQKYKLLSLLNLLCNTTQTTSTQTRDACYGCFFRAGSITNGMTQVASLADCATQYLAETNYAECSANLTLVANGNVQVDYSLPSSYCNTGYCDFVRCVRRINANELIDTCMTDNVEDRDLEVASDRIGLFLDVTSCILAKARCSAYNPITGEYQGQGLYAAKSTLSGLGSYYNALQVGFTGDIRIISFPSTTSVGELFCSRYPSLEQSAYQNYIC